MGTTTASFGARRSTRACASRANDLCHSVPDDEAVYPP
jgi:hypothetical protein